MLRLALIILIVFFIWIYLRNFEQNNIYFPTRLVELTPEERGLFFEEVFIATPDGKKINGWFIPSPDSEGTILFCHGNGGNIAHRIDFLELFNQAKFNVFIFDYRGYGKSNGRPSEKGLYIDAQSAYDYLKSRPDIDKEEIIIYGESLGGAVAVNLASRNRALALVTFGVFSSTVDIGKTLYPYLPVKLFISQKFDSLSKIKNIHVPKLIVHSLDDEIVPFTQGKALYLEAAPPKEFLELKGGHNEAILIEKEKFLKNFIDFIKNYSLK